MGCGAHAAAESGCERKDIIPSAGFLFRLIKLYTLYGVPDSKNDKCESYFTMNAPYGRVYV